MSNLFKKMLLPAAMLLLAASAGMSQASAQEYDAYAQNGPISTQDFYDDLAPYGQWIQDPQYGYVWSPSVDQTFRPYYTNGYWVMTEYGNTWVSNYPWGWATFHYGRWTYDEYYGWLWIPGTVWGPAWVSWRQSDAYYGWAPLGPGVNVSLSWGGGYYCPDTWWTFIPPQYIYSHNYYHYWYGPDKNRVIINNTTIINNTYVNNTNHRVYVTGPRATEIERHTNKPVQVFHLQSSSAVKGTSVKNGNVTMYHPMEVTTTTKYGAKPQPAFVAPAPRAVTRTPQSPGEGGTPAFRQEQQRTEERAIPVTPPVRQQVNQPKLQETEPTRYEYNPQRTPAQVAPQEPQRAQPTFERAASVQRQEAPQQPVHQSIPQQSFQRAQPAPQMSQPAPQISRPAAPQMQSAPRMQAAPVQRGAPPQLNHK